MQNTKSEFKNQIRVSSRIKDRKIKQNAAQQIKQVSKKFCDLSIFQDIQTKDHYDRFDHERNIEESQTKPQLKIQQKKQNGQEQTLKISKQWTSQVQYKKFLNQVCNFHIKNQTNKNQSKEVTSNKAITLEWFNKINQIWKSNKRVSPLFIKKTERVTYVQQLTYQLLKKLKPKNWLNDEIINSYIQLLQMDLIEKHSSNKQTKISVHLMQSFYAALKMTPQKIQRQIKKKKLDPSSLILIPINEDLHWFFLAVFNRNIYIFDSILPKQIKKHEDVIKKQYVLKKPIKRCIQLFQKINQIEQISLNNIRIIKQFPQQNNQDDCGMMMLCGIIQILKMSIKLNNHETDSQSLHLSIGKVDFWNYCMDDIKYYRYLFARQLIQQRLFQS